VVPALEEPRARTAAPDLELVTWEETDDPYRRAAERVSGRGAIGLADQMWAAFVLRLQPLLEGRDFRPASSVLRQLRMRKDEREIASLRAVAGQADRAFTRIREHAFGGRTEREIGADLADALREAGHETIAFTIVASGPNGASPHHETGARTIAGGEPVVLDFGGTYEGYCSDITRTVHVGAAVDAEIQRVHDVVRRAQEAGYAAARTGVPAESVDAAARKVIGDAGYGEFFVHRTGHGIGLDGHEHPYLVSGNREPLEEGMAFSIEPGIYLPGRFGIRIEDIAYIAPDGRAEPLNRADHGLAIVG
jgi:D-alanyl-D-alanine dipeptidase